MSFGQEQQKNPLDEKIRSLLSKSERTYPPFQWSELEVLLRPESTPLLKLSEIKWRSVLIIVAIIALIISGVLFLPSQIAERPEPPARRYTPTESEFQYVASEEEAKTLVTPLQDSTADDSLTAIQPFGVEKQDSVLTTKPDLSTRKPIKDSSPVVQQDIKKPLTDSTPKKSDSVKTNSNAGTPSSDTSSRPQEEPVQSPAPPDTSVSDQTPD